MSLPFLNHESISEGEKQITATLQYQHCSTKFYNTVWLGVNDGGGMSANCPLVNLEVRCELEYTQEGEERMIWTTTVWGTS